MLHTWFLPSNIPNLQKSMGASDKDMQRGNIPSFWNRIDLILGVSLESEQE